MFDRVFFGGTIITAEGSLKADIGIIDGKISAVGYSLTGGDRVDARGLYILPGAVDPHVHLEMPVGETRSSDDWRTGTIAAAYGGTTTVIDFVEPQPGQLLKEALAERIAQARDQAVVDYALHMTLLDANPETLNQLPDLVSDGCPSFKTYLAYEGFRLDDTAMLKILTAVKDCRGLVMVHAENDAIIQNQIRNLLARGKLTPAYQPLSRPAIAEREAIHRSMALAEAVQSPIYIVHISTAAGVRELEYAQQRGVNAIGETCPQYLLLNEREFDRPGFEGAKFVCAPPLRTAGDNQRLWQALRHGTISSVGTDHCPFNYFGQKDLGLENFSQIPGGLPGIESRLTLLYTYGVNRNILSPEQWVEICCTNPAKYFGLYPRKGTLIPGSDADIVLFDPNTRWTLSKDLLHEQVDYTPYEGMSVSGRVAGVYRRGEPVIQSGRFLGGSGNYLKCKTEL